MLKSTSETIESKVLHPEDGDEGHDPQSGSSTATWNKLPLRRGAEFTRDYLRTIYVVAFFLYCVLVGANAISLLPLKGLLTVTLVLVNIGIAAVTIPLESRRRNRLRRELGHRVDRPAIVDQFPVEIAIYTDGILTGEDQGWICFLPEFLVFQGRRTSFSLLNADVECRGSAFTELVRDPSPKKHFTRSLGDRLGWTNGSVSQRMTFLALETYRTPFGKDPIDLQVRAWMERRAPSDSFSTFPPLTATTEIASGKMTNLHHAIALALVSVPICQMVAHHEGLNWAAVFVSPVWAYSAYLIFDAIRFSRKTRKRVGAP
jgi:hypothetical protein